MTGDGLVVQLPLLTNITPLGGHPALTSLVVSLPLPSCCQTSIWLPFSRTLIRPVKL